MDNPTRPKINKKIIIALIFATVLVLTAGAVLDLWLNRELKKTARQQFNDQQMVIARNINHLITNKLDFLKKEILLTAKKIPAGPFDPKTAETKISENLSRVAERGVISIEITDSAAMKSYIYAPHRYWFEKKEPVDKKFDDVLNSVESSEENGIWISSAEKEPSGIMLKMGRYLSGSTPKIMVFKINMSWFLGPLLQNVRSGKTGYAWIIDDNGMFVFHPEPGFIGENAFKARKKKEPGLSYRNINFIQKEKMLKGLESTGSYSTGWHRGITGKIEKLIAYCPVDISATPPQKWSVAVVAPVSEIEESINRINVWRFLFQTMIIGIILLAGLSIMILEIRWSRALENKVSVRTKDLKKSEEKYRSLVESADDFIFTIDSEGKFQSMNSFTANFFGGSPDDFIGIEIQKVLTKEAAKKQLKMLDLVYRHKRSVRDDFQLRMGDHQIWISANFMPIRDDSGKVSTVLCIARDITEAKNLERQLVNTEKLAALGTLAAGVAHEINNPLGVILGFCDLLIRKKEKGSQEFEDLKTIERQGNHCKQIVENLLRFARHGEGTSTYSDVNQCLNEVTGIVAHTLEINDIELIMDLNTQIPPVRGNPRELQQVFLNLINNAIAAMKENGSLTIRTAIDNSRQKAIIQFKDTGTGIKNEDLDHIFEPFFTTKPEGEGTGLGLSVSYGIISKLGGMIDCVSSPTGSTDGRHGTIFTVKIPTQKQEA
ncbi:MAG: PAS domain S-box protein [Desulfobacteraceae bacterium]|nr:PAS domain S-box protein [Desulfobacteraceae bacterium]MBC2756149.1 PAS domain S-box protein [Desulfobacteraceae bacterium]